MIFEALLAEIYSKHSLCERGICLFFPVRHVMLFDSFYIHHRKWQKTDLKHELVEEKARSDNTLVVATHRDGLPGIVGAD